MLQTRKANPDKPFRFMAYGVEGVGKSTLGAKADRPVFISAEGGTDQLTDAEGNPTEEMPNVKTWDDVIKSVTDLTTVPHNFKTLVIDSADWIENLAHAKIVGTSGKTITTVNGGYGAGYRQSQQMHKELIDMLTVLREKKNMNIIVTAHAHVKTVKDPSMLEDYDAFEIKCHEFVSALWREWVDGLFFIRFATFIKSDDDTSRARAFGNGKRVLYTEKQPSFQAKNRYNMPAEIEFTPWIWKDLIKFLKKGPSEDSTYKEILDHASTITDAQLKSTVLATAEQHRNNPEMLTATLNRLKQLAQGEAKKKSTSQPEQTVQ